MNLITNYLICYNLRSLPALNKQDIYEKLKPYLGIHSMNITHERIVFSDLNLSVFFSVTHYKKVNSIKLEDIVLIMDQPDGFIKIILRSGYFHALSKNSSIRIHRHMFESQRITSKLEVFFWRHLIMLPFFIKKSKLITETVQ